MNTCHFQLDSDWITKLYGEKGKIMKQTIFLLIVGLLFPTLSQANDYPGREVYRNVPIYETEQLNKTFNDVVIIDVRSSYEFETLHINTSINIPLNNKGFARAVSASRTTESIPIVFYCNGHTCYKSYKAVVKAQKAGIKNIFAYDSGIFDWASAHPDKATMVGTTPIDPARLISKAKLKEYLLDPDQFVKKVNKKTVILDIREPAQRGLLELFPYRQENISLDQKKKLVQFLNKIKKSGKTLLVYDEAGKQVRWLQYYLEAKGISNYYFMSGGVKNYFKATSS